MLLAKPEQQLFELRRLLNIKYAAPKIRENRGADVAERL